MNQSTYNALPGLNNSGMKWLEKSPAHFKAWKAGQFGESTPAMELGIAIHCAVLEPESSVMCTWHCLIPLTLHPPVKKPR